MSYEVEAKKINWQKLKKSFFKDGTQKKLKSRHKSEETFFPRFIIFGSLSSKLPQLLLFPKRLNYLDSKTLLSLRQY